MGHREALDEILSNTEKLRRKLANKVKANCPACEGSGCEMCGGLGYVYTLHQHTDKEASDDG